MAAVFADGKESGLGADDFFYDPLGPFEVGVLFVGVDIGHDLPPDGHGEELFCLVQLGIVVIAGPDSSGVIWRITGEPDVVALLGRAGLAGNGCGREIGRSTGTWFFHNIFHGAGQEPAGRLFEDAFLFRFGVVQKNGLSLGHTAVGVPGFVDHGDFGIEAGNDVLASVGDGREGCIELDVAHTEGDAAQGKGLVDVGEDLSVDFLVIHQSVDPEILRIFKSHPGGDLGQEFYGHDIEGIPDGIAHGLNAPISLLFLFIPVVDLYTVVIGVFFIDLGGGESKGHSVYILCPGAVEGGRKSADDLESGAGLAGRIRSAVQGAAGFFFTASAEHGYDIAGLLVGDGHGDLRLGSQLIILFVGVLGTDDGLAESLDVFFRAAF